MSKKPIDICIKETQENLALLLSGSGLSLGIIKLILSDVTKEVDIQYEQNIEKLIKEQSEAKPE